MKCVALLSGGLDSMLAIRIMQQQEIEVEALNFKTVFTCCQDMAGQTARELGVPVTVIGQQDDYLELVRKPRFGYGRGANPCIDCRIYMFQKSYDFMRDIGADFIVSGEVVGQRPMSQKRRDLLAISHHSQLEDLLLRPLSAKLLPETKPEREGWVDRERLYSFNGRNRKLLIKLGKELGLRRFPAPSSGCALTEPKFSEKVFDLIRTPLKASRWDYELLKVGRHFRLDTATKVIVGRTESENGRLEYMHALPDSSATALLMPFDFVGPCAMVVGAFGPEAREFASGLLLRYSKNDATGTRRIRLLVDGKEELVPIEPSEAAEQAVTLGA